MKLIATKTFSYGTRRLAVGEPFDARSDRDGRLLLAAKKAKVDKTRPVGKLPPPDRAEAERIRSSVAAGAVPASTVPASPAAGTPFEAQRMAELTELRGKAEAAGVKVDARWGPQRLRDEIARAAAAAPATPPPASDNP